MKTRSSARIILGLSFVIGVLAMSQAMSTGKSRYFFETTGVNEPTAWVQTVQQDTTKSDSIRRADSLAKLPYQPSRTPTFQPTDRYGDPFRFRQSASPLLLGNPTGYSLKGQIDTSMNYSIFETIGDVNYRPAATMSFNEFNTIQTQQLVKDYWQEKSAGLDGESAVSGRNLIPKLYFSPIFDRIFGGSYIELKPSGFVTLDFGWRWQRTDNPALSNRAQRQGGFEFDLGINMNVVGSVGDKLKITTNFDNKRSFDFENNFRVEYTGYEEEIIKKIEIGNVSLPLNNTLITGSQNLFGLKSQWQFGKLFVTGVASTQRSTQQQICIEGGVQGRQFELRGSDYDENRHFFLGHFFRDNYEQWLNRLPQVTSSVNVTRVVVYVLNRNRETASLRNVSAYMDLGEGNSNNLGLPGPNSPVQPLLNGGGNLPTDNGANNLFATVNGLTRDPNALNADLEALGMVRTVDFEKITGARRLNDQEFNFHRQLGYISLFRKLQSDEMLAVAYEYTYNGQTFQVGELPENYSDRPDDDVIIMKLLRPTRINTAAPTWDLMMKNVYNLGASQLSKDNFQLRVIYRDDLTGQDQPHLQEGIGTKDVPLVRIFGLDRLNVNGDTPHDGNFDYVENLTINSTYGLVVFPVLEPFGRTLVNQFDPEREQLLIDKFGFDTLYRTTRADAELIASKNKFFLKGSYQAAGGGNNEIMLSAIALTEGEGAISVTAGGTPLTEGVQFQVDYFTGRIRILDESIMASGKEICVSFEKDDLFNVQRKNMVGLRADYRVSPDINIGGTLLHLNEVPQFTRMEIGTEPVSNTQWGLDLSLRKDSRFLTRMVDFLPLIQTKETSTINLNAEFAQLLPGTSNLVDGEGTSYIDDFEEAATPFNLASTPQQNWKLAATPQDGGSGRFIPNAGVSASLQNNYRRAKMAWYQVDNLFYRNNGPKPDHLEDEDLNNHYVRLVFGREVFPGRDEQATESNWPIFDVAYYPNERGPYNFNPALDNRGLLRNPQENWAGITRAITSENDFDAINIEYIEFWVMDPFREGPLGVVQDGVINSNNTTGGKLIFHLGNISEDLIPDGRHAFENGLPVAEDDLNFVSNDYGVVTTDQWLNDAFDATTGGQDAQDVGMDGIGDERERTLPSIQSSFFDQITDPAVRALVAEDPAADNFQYFLGDALDGAQASILQRYKNFNGMEGNTPKNPENGNGYTALGNPFPDNEDLNKDNTLSDLEQYYEYELELRPDMRVGENYIVDKVRSPATGSEEEVDWYLFRVPIRRPNKVINDINGYKSIRYMRMVMTDWEQPVVLRFARFQVVGNKWRKSPENLDELGFTELPEEEDPDFLASVVSVADNRQGGDDRVSYILPEGFIRDRDLNSPIYRELNEQSLSLCINDLKDGNTRAVYKNVNMDLVNYGRVKMFFHGDSPDAQNGEVTAFLRMGTDYTDNYYEIEVPLQMTPYGEYADDQGAIVWPEANEIDISLDDLFAIKSERNRNGASETLPYPQIPKIIENQSVTVKGNPDISSVQVLMIGVRNRSGDGLPRSVCVWANELRVTDFDQNNGWAANVRLATKLADLADVTTSGRYVTAGYGNLQQKIYERTRDETWQFDVTANVQMHKFFPSEWGLRIPMFVSYEASQSTPFFDPADPDTPLRAALAAIGDEDERSEYMEIVTANNTRRSLNFTGVRKERTNLERIPMPYDLSNFTFSYAFTDQVRDDFNTASFVRRRYNGGFVYNYTPPELKLEPFKNIEFLNNPYFELIKSANINFAPANITVQADLERQFTRTILRKADLSPNFGDAYFEKFFTFNRRYSVRWNITSQLTTDYQATVNALIDEPEGDINTTVKQDSIISNIRNLGRMKNFNQSLRANYSVPFSKFPLTDWITTDANYDVGYIWTAGSFDQIDSLGNVMENSRTMGLTGRLDLTKLYNKITYLKDINTPPRASRTPIPDSLQPGPGEKILQGALRTLMLLRSANFTFSRQERTMLPGFRPQPFLVGLDSGFTAPGWEFLLGSQSDDIKRLAVENGWLVLSPILTQPFQQSRTETLTMRAILEPFADFRINLNADKRKTDGFQELFRYDTTINAFASQTPSRTGNYSVSMISIGTAFSSFNRETGESAVFNQMSANREIFRQRLQSQSNGAGEFSPNSQDVLINSFLAAINGEDANQRKLSNFPRIPLPNWRVDYNGLTKLDFVKEYFTSVTISHGYTSTYSVASYNNALAYQDNLSPSNSIEDYSLPTQVTTDGKFIPRYIVDQVMVSEKFSPLIGINVRTKNRMTFQIDYKRGRDISLNILNSQVTDLVSQDFSINIGFIKSGMKLPIRWRGAPVTLKNDLNFRLGMTLRDSQTVQRKFDEDSQVTAGMLNFQTRPTVTYVANDKINVTLYFEHSRNLPYTNQSFPRTTTAFGVLLRVSLTQ